MKFDTVIFDLDGTLVHTAPDLLRATNYVLDLNGRPPIKMEQFSSIISFGAKVMIKHGFELTGDPVAEDELDDKFQQLIAYYLDHIAVDSAPFNGCIDLLEKCQAKGMKLGVCTNKQERFAVKLLDQLDMSKYFGAIIGADTVNIGKPDPAPYFETVKRIDGNLQSSIMIGDSKIDVLTAKAAKVPVIGVTFGYTNEPIKEMECDYLAGNFGEMEKVLFL